MVLLASTTVTLILKQTDASVIYLLTPSLRNGREVMSLIKQMVEEKQVKILRLVVKNTLEENIWELMNKDELVANDGIFICPLVIFCAIFILLHFSPYFFARHFFLETIRLAPHPCSLNCSFCVSLFSHFFFALSMRFSLLFLLFICIIVGLLIYALGKTFFNSAPFLSWYHRCGCCWTTCY